MQGHQTTSLQIEEAGIRDQYPLKLQTDFYDHLNNCVIYYGSVVPCIIIIDHDLIVIL